MQMADWRMTMNGRSNVDHWRWMAILVASCGVSVLGCHDKASTNVGGDGGLDGGDGSSCVDHDGDGFGQGCAKGADCDDNDPTKNVDCSPSTDGKGPGCPEPPQGPIQTDWPEVFVGKDNCDDSGPGTREQPFCSFQPAIDANDAPAVVTVLDGTYRGLDVWKDHNVFTIHKAGTADAYFVVRADDGAHPVFLGSTHLDKGVWEDAGGGLMRTPADSFITDPKGLWQADGTRILHVMKTVGGTRSHADATQLADPGTWTKADDSGIGCPKDNAGCFLYLRPPDGVDPNAQEYEVSSGHLFHIIASPYVVIEGLTTRFTQPTAINLEGHSDYALIRNNDFGHNANGNDNSYSIFLSYSDGLMVYGNKAFDSRYWGGTPNSKGITFMDGGDGADMWLCDNEIWGVIGQAVATKSGVSHLHVIHNYIHDVGIAIQHSGIRCHWKGCDGDPDGHTYAAGAWEVRENLVERCKRGFEPLSYPDAPAPDPSLWYPSVTENNLFRDCEYGVELKMDTPNEYIRNNVFIGGSAGILLNGAGSNAGPDEFLQAGMDSDYNLFFQTPAYMKHPDSSANSYYPGTLDEDRAQNAGEEHSISGDPLLDDQNRPKSGSPAIDAGDPSVYSGSQTVNIGLWPFYHP